MAKLKASKMTDRDERIAVDSKPSEPQLSAWREWFRHHGIDPTYVPTSNSILRRPAACQIACDMYDLHEGKDGVRFTTGRIVKQQVFQLEEPPLPFPALQAVGLEERESSAE